MLREFLDALPEHLESGGEGWLILSDLAEHLGYERGRSYSPCSRAELRVVGSTQCAADTSPHGR